MSFEAIAQDRLIQSQVQSLPEMVRELSKYEIPNWVQEACQAIGSL